jgi:NitT/TauT family transport system ATP-binding protein
MRQRVSIARAFAIEPAILLCDEPFSALDEVTGSSLRSEFLQLVRETKATGIFITHSINEALAFGHRILVLPTGRHRLRRGVAGLARRGRA